MIKKLAVLIIEPTRVKDHLLQVQDVLLETIGHLLYLDQFMAVMLVEDALDTDCLSASSAEILNVLLWMAAAQNCRQTIKLVIK